MEAMVAKKQKTAITMFNGFDVILKMLFLKMLNKIIKKEIMVLSKGNP